MPHKKWYLLIDDDTYLIKTSLHLLLEHLDPDKPQYIGNPVGDFRARFAHGGSAVMLSRPTLHALFIDHPTVAAAAHSQAIIETWGDRLLATTLMRIGIYLDEKYARFFSGERPLETQIRADRFCMPLISFHGLADPKKMREVGETFARTHEPVLWSDLWKIYHGPDFDELTVAPVRDGWDHVGHTDESTGIAPNIKSAQSCLELCKERSDCLAWIWHRSNLSCKFGPRVIVGQKNLDASSGVIAARVRKLMDECRDV